jgi:inner membrane protein
MPSPIAHTTLGYVIYKTYGRRRMPDPARRSGPFSPLLLISAGLSLLPDLDSIFGFLLRDFGRYHNNGSHSLVVGLAVALATGGLVRYWKGSGFGYWFGLVFLCYQFHVILDFFTVGRGVMLFWPFSPERFASPIKLFYGLHWSDGLVSVKHLWTGLSEGAFAGLLILAIQAFSGKLRPVKFYRPIRRAKGFSQKEAE